MNLIKFTWAFLEWSKTKTSEGKIDRARFRNVLTWFLTVLVFG